MNNRHPWPLKKSKSWGPFWSYQLNSTANPAHLPQNWAKFEVNGLDWQCCLAGSSLRTPRILIFSIAMGAESLFYVKSIETHARAFLTINIPSIGTVYWINQYLHIYNSKKSIIYSLAFCPFSAKNSILRIYLLAFLEEQKAWW